MQHELRGIELVRTVTSQQVWAVALFKAIFWILSLTKITWCQTCFVSLRCHDKWDDLD